MSKCSRKRKTLSLPCTEAYELVASGELKKFPNGYLSQDMCKEILRYVFLEKLHMTRKDICNNASPAFLQKYGLGGFRKRFNSSVAELISYSFSDMEIMPWELKKLANNFWEKDGNMQNFMLWLMKKENIDFQKLSDLRKISARMIEKYGGSRARHVAGGTFELIDTVNKGHFKEWEISKNVTWTEEKGKVAVKWLIEEKLNWTTDEEIFNGLTAKIFRENHLSGFLQHHCQNSPLKAINIAYPGRFTSLKRAQRSH